MTKPKEPTQQVVVGFQAEHRIYEAVSSEKDNSRPILGGVFVDPAGYLVATNGYIMAVCPFTMVEGSTLPKDFTGCVLPADVLKAGYQANPKSGAWIPLHLDLETKTVFTGNKTGGSSTGDFIPGTFPLWREFIPEKASLGNRKAQNYNVDYLSRLFLATGLGKTGQVQLKDDFGGLVVGTDGAFGIQMSVRSVDPDAKALTAIFKLRPKPPKAEQLAEAA